MNAVATFQGLITGSVTFHESPLTGILTIKGELRGFKNLRCGRPRSLHGFHVHNYGDLRDHCQKACSHFNPDDRDHGGLLDPNSHAGDLGNIEINKQGVAVINLQTRKCSLSHPQTSIIGRSLMVHADEDDLGRGGFKDSLETGHAGKRLACAVIGITSECA